MKDLIERYIYDVKRRLKEDQRAEIEKELRTNIEDMLANDYSDENIQSVLLSLGSPAKLANNYKEPRYLISPDIFDDYIRVLTIVLIVFSAVGIIGGSIGVFFQTNLLFEDILEMIFGSVADALFTGFGVTTLVFVGIESYRRKYKPAFKLESLPKVPKVESKKSLRFEVILESTLTLVFGIIFVVAMMQNYADISVTIDSITHTYSGAVLNQALVNIYIVAFVAYLGISTIIRMFRLKEGGYTRNLAIIYTVSEFLSILMLTVIFTQPNIFVPGFIDTLEAIASTNLKEAFALGIKGIISIIWIIFSIDQIVLWYKQVKQSKKSI